MNPSGTTGIVIPAGLEIVGELLASEDLTIQGVFDGQITMPDHHLSINAGSSVKGKVVARAVTIGGTLDGTILATERIDLMPTAIVRAHLTTAKIMLADGAKFQGTIDPERTEAATHVARFREKQSSEG
jgi:cytoskeletal protein CcmA (bactofilin family)